MSEEHTLENEPVVTYTVKDVLKRIEDKLDGFFGRLDNLETRVGRLEAEREHRSTNWENRRWLVMALASLAAGLAAVITLLVHG